MNFLLTEVTSTSTSLSSESSWTWEAIAQEAFIYNGFITKDYTHKCYITFKDIKDCKAFKAFLEHKNISFGRVDNNGIKLDKPIGTERAIEVATILDSSLIYNDPHMLVFTFKGSNRAYIYLDWCRAKSLKARKSVNNITVYF